MSSDKLPWLTNKKRCRVAVLGDLILDEYLEGEVSRISPEAPVPVNLVKQTILRAGGAANAALNIQRAGGQACLVGVCGDDGAGKDLRGILEESHIECEHIIIDRERPTTRKTRISANRQQIVRVDWERVSAISQVVEDRLCAALRKVDFDALLISDYGKGGLTETFIETAISIARAKGAKVVIDPKGHDYNRYKGAFLITPNRKEATLALKLDPSENHPRDQLGRGLYEQFGIENVLVTLGGEGMFLYTSKDATKDRELFLPAQAREVFDVSGAGDTVAAMVALGLAAKSPLKESVFIANLAAAIVVGKWGTQPVEQHEIEQAYLQRLHPNDGRGFSTREKIKNLSDVIAALGPIRSRTRRVVFTNGCFDILHAGHVSYLEKARGLGDLLVVAVNSDASVRKLKGPSRPVIDAEHRKQLLAALSCVDYVIEFNEDTPFEVIKALVPNVLVKGADWAKDKIIGGDLVEQAGGVVQTIEFVPGISTSEVVSRIKADKGV